MTDALFAIDADPEYKTRIEAERCTWQFSDKLRPSAPQQALDDLPLFGGQRQKSFFEEENTNA